MSILAAILAVAAGWGSEPMPATTRFSVVLGSEAVPAWYAYLRIPGWTAVDDSSQADALVEVAGDDPVVVWTAYRSGGDECINWGHHPGNSHVFSALGLGNHRLVVTLRQRISGTVLASVDLSRTNEFVRCGDVPSWYLHRDDVWLPTPAGVAHSWRAQAWATGFMRTELVLRARLASASQ